MNIIRLALLLPGMACTRPAIAQNATPPNQQLTLYLAQVDSLFGNVPAWLWNLYEPASGGFYENIAMRPQPNRFGPGIQSTTQALGILADYGRPASQLPDSIHRQVIHFFQSRQEAKTGFFVDSHYPQARQSERVTGRLVRFSTVQLSKLGSAPRYPLSGQQVGSSTTLSYYALADSLRKWLDRLPWDKSVWSSMDAISSQTSLLNTLPEATQKVYTRQMYDYALARQNADGLWGEGQPVLVRLSGSVKFAWFCRDAGLALPNPEKIYHTLLAWYRTHPSQQDDFKQDTCFPGNTIGLLGELMSYFRVRI